MELSVVLGFAGDSINCLSAILLAWDPLLEKRLYLRREADKALPKEVEFLDHKLKPIPRGDALERTLVSGETTRARWGFGLLILGFLMLLISRGLEARRPATPPACPTGHSCASP